MPPQVPLNAKDTTVHSLPLFITTVPPAISFSPTFFIISGASSNASRCNSLTSFPPSILLNNKSFRIIITTRFVRKKIFKKIRKRLPERIPHSRHGLHPTKDYSTILHTLHSLMFPSENFARVEINQIDFVCLIIFERFAICISLMKRKERRRRRSHFSTICVSLLLPWTGGMKMRSIREVAS